MKLILNLLLLFVVFALVRRGIRRYLVPPRQRPPDPPGSGTASRGEATSKVQRRIDENQIEDADFEELD